MDAILEESGTAGGTPTNEHAVLDFLGLKLFSCDLSKELDLPEIPTPGRDLRALLIPSELLVVTHCALARSRSRFSIFHEVGHFILPEHQEKLFLDNDETLSWRTHARLEREANQLAADLIFQGKRFTEEAEQCPLSCRTILELAPRYGASYEATARRYIEAHVLPCAVIVYDRLLGAEDEGGDEPLFRLHYTITSPTFGRQYFSALESDTPLRVEDICSSRLRVGDVHEAVLSIDGGQMRFRTEVFTNHYKIFQVLTNPIPMRFPR